jgi:hypothetical protein
MHIVLKGHHMFNSALKSIALATLIATSGAAAFAASDRISANETQDFFNSVDLDFVSASGNGTVAIYDYSNGEQGKLLGTETINAGANQNVNVRLSPAATHDVVAVLTVGGQTAAVQEIENDDRS